MSTHGLQLLLNQLIRFPESHRGEEIESFILGFDLSEKEKWQARSLAVSHYVSKFGKERRWKRYRTYVRHFFPVTVKGIKDQQAQTIFFNEFEPAHPQLRLGEITSKFYRYFLANEERLRATYQFPDYCADTMRYEFAEHCLHFSKPEFVLRGLNGSQVNARAEFIILDLQYDLVSFCEQARPLPEEEIVDLRPEKSPTIVLLTKIPNSANTEDYSLSQFVIDENLKAFLLNQTDGGNAVAEIPPCFNELVELGLCVSK